MPTLTTPHVRPLALPITSQEIRAVISFDAIAMAIAQERQTSERRNRRWMAMAAARRERGAIRQWIGQRFIRLGERLAAAPLREPAR